MLLGVAAPKKKSASKKGRTGTPKKKTARGASFPAAFAELLKSRKIRVPRGLSSAPPEAYANQPASFVETLSRLSDDELRAHADKIAAYKKRQEDRARTAWEGSPLIKEIRRRKLKEPPRPGRVVGAAFSVKKPLGEWTDKELLAAAKEWSRRGRP